MQDEPIFGKDYLQERILSEFALARHIGIVVERADDDRIVLSAPLGPNANHQATAFGGSLFSVAVLTGWAWLTRYLDVAQLAADAVVQESTIRYLVPVQGVLRATLTAPPSDHVDKFRKMLQRAGRGRIRLAVDIHHGSKHATEFEGVFVAAIRSSSHQ
ncbi:MAG: thioesterase domain protein [Gammaproteobacteria bacterium]|nr:thioesterase domain protein [Gammaproteobacteria bacterium]